MTCSVLDVAERAVEVGSQLVTTLGAISRSAPASNAHGNAVALKSYSMLSSDGLETMEEEEQSESDVEMETQGERGRTYMNS